MPAHNRKLLVSVFDAQESREAVLGGGRIIDSEDPRSALGNIKPRHIMAVSDAVLDFKTGNEVQLSTNIGEDQLLFRRSDTGQAIEKSPYEIAGKAAQAAIGVAASMGTRVHPVGIVKVGLDGMTVHMLKQVLSEVVLTLQRTEHYAHTQVMSVLFAQDLDAWRNRKDLVRKELVELREFAPALSDKQPGAFDLLKDEVCVRTLRGAEGGYLFEAASQVTLESLIANGILPSTSTHSFVAPTELFAHETFFQNIQPQARTSREVITAMVDATADSGANAIMLDTSILSKICNICLVDTANSEMIDLNRLHEKNGMPRTGILNLKDLRYFVDYCHHRGLIANLAGSLDSYQAQMIWVLIPELDQLSVRGAASRVVKHPQTGAKLDSRQHRCIYRTLVRGLAPPEQGGVLNLSGKLRDHSAARREVAELRKFVSAHRKSLGLPELSAFWIDEFGQTEPMT